MARGQGRVRRAIRWPAALSVIRVSSLRSRVSSRLALITQCVAVRWYHGACASKNAAAFRFARSFFSWAGVSFAASSLSKA